MTKEYINIYIEKKNNNNFYDYKKILKDIYKKIWINKQITIMI